MTRVALRAGTTRPDPGVGLRFCVSSVRSRPSCSEGKISEELKLGMKLRKKILSHAKKCLPRALILPEGAE